MNEYTDFLCGCLIQIGNFIKIRKHYTGWLISMFAIGYWVIRGYSTGFVSQTFWHLFSFCMATYGFIKWRYKDALDR